MHRAAAARALAGVEQEIVFGFIVIEADLARVVRFWSVLAGRLVGEYERVEVFCHFCLVLEFDLSYEELHAAKFYGVSGIYVISAVLMRYPVWLPMESLA
jgi:hypothetical protein